MSIHYLATRLAWVGLLWGCASNPGPDVSPAPCGSGSGTALLEIGCQGDLVPGRATVQVSGQSVSLRLVDGESGRAQALVSTWPGFDEAPWLGHSVLDVVVLPGERIQVRFADGPAPLALFADPRLGFGAAAPVRGDARDRIDAGDAWVTTSDEVSISYGRRLGREVVLQGFDRGYFLVVPVHQESRVEELVDAAVTARWVQSGEPGTRRRPRVSRDAPVCHLPEPTPLRRGPVSGAAATIWYAYDDPAAEDLTQRIVSAALARGGRGGDGPGVRLSPRRVSPAGSVAAADSDVAAVVSVHVDPAHPCSVAGELSQAGMEIWGGGPLAYIPLGETAVFRIGPDEAS